MVDGLGHRVAKRVDGVLVRGWVWEGLSIVAEYDGYGLVNRFVPGGMVRGSVEYRIVRDHLGSPRLVVDAQTGEVVQHMDFDEFGNVLQDTAPGFQPIGFAGGLWDPDTGLVRFGARDYDATIGRWTARDPILFQGGDSNLYGYVASDPINIIDPAGLEGVGHHWVPQFIWQSIPLPDDVKRVFDKAVSGATEPPHNFRGGHSKYNKAVGELWNDFVSSMNKPLCEYTIADAHEFIYKVGSSENPDIYKFNERIIGEAATYNWLKSLGLYSSMIIFATDFSDRGGIAIFDAAGSIPFGGMLTPTTLIEYSDELTRIENATANYNATHL